MLDHWTFLVVAAYPWEHNPSVVAGPLVFERKVVDSLRKAFAGPVEEDREAARDDSIDFDLEFSQFLLPFAVFT